MRVNVQASEHIFLSLASITVLREALAALGLPESFQRHLRPVVTQSGIPFVHMGLVPCSSPGWAGADWFPIAPSPSAPLSPSGRPLPHHHGYLSTGPKQRFDQEALRRPPYPDPPPAGSRPELVQRYREVAAEFPSSDLPPLETALWLMKPATVVRGTWDEPKEAAAWLAERLADYAPRFSSDAERVPAVLARYVNFATEQLRWGSDAALGVYLERPVFLSLALVTCSPNRTAPDLPCPAQRPESAPSVPNGHTSSWNAVRTDEAGRRAGGGCASGGGPWGRGPGLPRPGRR